MITSSLFRVVSRARRPLLLNVIQHRCISSHSTVFTFTRSASSSSSSSSSSLDDESRLVDQRDLLKFDTLASLQSNACRNFADNALFGTYNSDTTAFEWMDYKSFDDKVALARGILKDLGIGKYDKVGIISNNRWEWAATAAAAYSLNATLVPMYEAQLPKDWTYILNDSQCSALMCATQDVYDRVMTETIDSVPSLSKESVLCFDASNGEDYSFSAAMVRATPLSNKLLKSEAPIPDDLANLIYTSGTTGVPKGVELTHNNTVSNIIGVRSMVDDPLDFIRQTDVSLAFLPWAHSYGQTCELWCGMAHGSSIGICRGVPSILEDLQLVKPTVLFSVPTLYKKVYDGVNNIIATTNPIRRGLMSKAIELGKAHAQARSSNKSLGFFATKKFEFLDKIVLAKIRDRFGGNLRHGFVAGAACPREIIDFMDAIGIEIYEGYGLTETSPIICINSPNKRKVGAVGFPIPGVTVLVLGENGEVLGPYEEGEICCYGPNVMRGYHGKPKETQEAISVGPDEKSRLFHSGDLGRMSGDGFIYITGRIKEQYKLENGKYVCPTPVEEAMGMSRFIMQTVLVGANRPTNVALIVPDWIAIRNHLKIPDQCSEEELVNDSRVKELLNTEIQDNCLHANIKKFEIPTAWSIVAPFTAANSMLTPKMSIRRHMVVRAYKDIIGLMYGDMEDDIPKVSSEEAAA